VPSAEAPPVAIPFQRKHLSLTRPAAAPEGSKTILERKFHLLTIGNICAVVSQMEVWEGFLRDAARLWPAGAQLPELKA
jgi:hypothetical protein